MRSYSTDTQSTIFDIGKKYHWNVTDQLLDIEPVFGRKMPVWKRSIDIAFAVTGIIFLFPFLLLIALLIKIVSPGPIFFKQERVGFGGKIFTMFKLRTMAHNTDTTIHKEYLASLINADENDNGTGSTRVMKKIENDSRVVPFGKILRSSGFDELPQLINVLLGDMSLIGPRPPIPYEVDQYKNWFSDRFDIVPGLTGLWQVSGKNNLTFHEMIRLDIQYIRNHSFWLDLKILLLTPVAIINIIKDSYRK
ncbi:sugar transferase [candidate division WS5 bacterium]|uniref:Sugar transferase n=1 Tax=candidate division WS5 bacterium TaxID=2093353 RepID=A0A419DAP2_9BACT|nr:MAG: sugar transferase [candidate division WS5 bacterium]